MSIGDMGQADFSPILRGYSGQGAFRFWCQTVLPLVYDDSLSYYELLNKIVTYLNNTISDVSNVEDNVTALAGAYDQLQQYVNDYFDSLDVQEEINNKLDEMATDGSLTELVEPYLPAIIGAWLGEHITPTSPALDNTFLVPNSAALSTAVGDMFNKTLVNRGSISSSDDLDTLKSISGMYYCSVANSSSVANSPWSGKSYTLIVRAGTTPNATSGQMQLAVNNNGKIATRYYLSSSWSSWRYDIDTIDFDMAMVTRGTISANDDLDDYQNVSGMYYCAQSDAASVSNAPWNDGFNLFVKCATTPNPSGGAMQIAYSISNKCAYRCKVAGAWQAWFYPDDFDNTLTSSDKAALSSAVGSMFNKTLVTRDSIAANDDLDTYKTVSGCYYCTQANSRSVANVPWYNESFALFVKSGTIANATSGQAQFAISFRGEFACRFYIASSWSRWIHYASEFDVSNFSLALLENVGVCGGSYDSGYSYNANNVGVTNLDNAWLSILGREHTFASHVYAYHGTSIPEWFDPNYSAASYCYTKFASDIACDLYFLTFGANDTINGSIADCAAFDADPTATPTTFYGWYAKLVYTVKTKAPNAKIIIVTPESAGIISAMTSAITAVNAIANYYELPVITLNNNLVWRANAINLTKSGSSGSPHPTPYGYGFMAAIFDKMISDCVLKNPAYFNTWMN